MMRFRGEIIERITDLHHMRHRIVEKGERGKAIARREGKAEAKLLAAIVMASTEKALLDPDYSADDVSFVHDAHIFLERASSAITGAMQNWPEQLHKDRERGFTLAKGERALARSEALRANPPKIRTQLRGMIEAARQQTPASSGNVVYLPGTAREADIAAPVAKTAR